MLSRHCFVCFTCSWCLLDACRVAFVFVGHARSFCAPGGPRVDSPPPHRRVRGRDCDQLRVFWLFADEPLNATISPASALALERAFDPARVGVHRAPAGQRVEAACCSATSTRSRAELIALGTDRDFKFLADPPEGLKRERGRAVRALARRVRARARARARGATRSIGGSCRRFDTRLVLGDRAGGDVPRRSRLRADPHVERRERPARDRAAPPRARISTRASVFERCVADVGGGDRRRRRRAPAPARVVHAVALAAARVDPLATPRARGRRVLAPHLPGGPGAPRRRSERRATASRNAPSFSRTRCSRSSWTPPRRCRRTRTRPWRRFRAGAAQDGPRRGLRGQRVQPVLLRDAQPRRRPLHRTARVARARARASCSGCATSTTSTRTPACGSPRKWRRARARLHRPPHRFARPTRARARARTSRAQRRARARRRLFRQRGALDARGHASRPRARAPPG